MIGGVLKSFCGSWESFRVVDNVSKVSWCSDSSKDDSLDTSSDESVGGILWAV